MANWGNSIDYLWCNKLFFGHPRFDHAIVATEGRPFFVQLLSLFKIQVDTHSHSMALIKAYGRPSGRIRRKDRDFGLYHVQVKSSPYQVIPIESIIRGAVLVADSDNPDEYFIVDTIDGDMFLRMSEFSL